MSEEREALTQADLEESYDAFSELCKHQADNPRLRGNPYYQALIDTAWARFFVLFKEGERR